MPNRQHRNFDSELYGFERVMKMIQRKKSILVGLIFDGNFDGIYRLITIIILFANFRKPYSSEPKLRRLRFGTFWRFLTFNLAKLSLKAETSRMEMDFWKKFSHFALQGKNFWNYGFMVDTQTLPATMPSFSYITCIKRNCLLLSGGASQEREA